MIPCNDFTAKEQRFFYPRRGPIEHHTSFETQGLPSVKALEGVYARSIVTTEEGDRASYEATGHRTDIPQGATVGHIALLGSASVLSLPKNQPAIMELYREAPTKYEPNSEDTLIVEVDGNAYTYDPSSQGRKLHDSQGLFLHPAQEPLPELIHKSKEAKSDGVFRVVGIIDGDNTLIAWEGQGANRWVDWCITYDKAINGLELYLLQEDIGNGGSLRGHISASGLVKMYLSEFNRRTGIDLLPNGEPDQKAREFPALTPAEIERFQFITDSARKIKS